MKLLELLGVKKHTKLTLTQLIKVFEKLSGYKFAGGGHFAKVFKHPSKDEVIKFWVEDTAYEKYVNYCIKNPSNKYLPKIYTPIKSLSTFHKRLNGFPDKIKYVRMELLRPLKNSDIGKLAPGANVKKIIDDFYIYIVDNEETEVNIKDYKTPTKWDKEQQRIFNKLAGYWDDDVIPDKIYDLYVELNNIPLEIGSQFDLHSANIMVRPGSNDLVLSDPVVSTGSLESMDYIIHDAPTDDDIQNMPDEYTITGKSKSKS